MSTTVIILSQYNKLSLLKRNAFPDAKRRWYLCVTKFLLQLTCPRSYFSDDSTAQQTRRALQHLLELFVLYLRVMSVETKMIKLGAEA